MNTEMNPKQKAKPNIYRVSEKHVGDNASIIAANAAFQQTFNKFKANIAATTNTAQQKSAALTGIAADKNNARQRLCKFAASIAGVIYAYASANNNETLKQEMNLPVTTLVRTRDEALAPRCQMIHDRAQTNLVALDDYGIKAAQLENLQTAIDNYSPETSRPRHAVSSRKTANANLAVLFKENDILKNQMDKLIELYHAAYPDFVQIYESTRIIVDPPTKPRKTEDKSNTNE